MGVVREVVEKICDEAAKSSRGEQSRPSHNEERNAAAGYYPSSRRQCGLLLRAKSLIPGKVPIQLK